MQNTILDPPELNAAALADVHSALAAADRQPSPLTSLRAGLRAFFGRRGHPTNVALDGYLVWDRIEHSRAQPLGDDLPTRRRRTQLDYDLGLCLHI